MSNQKNLLIEKEEPIYVCPFKGHLVRKSDAAKHFVLCKEQQKDFKQCPFNVDHWTQDLEEHLKVCLQRKKIGRLFRIKPVEKCTLELNANEESFDITIQDSVCGDCNNKTRKREILRTSDKPSSCLAKRIREDM